MKVAVGIRGTAFSPWNERWQECLDTWGGFVANRDISVKVHLGDPNLDVEYKIDNNIFWSRCPDKEEGILHKTFYYPFKWFLNETDYDYFFVVDCDTFVHPTRFFDYLKELEQTKYDYVGFAVPMEGEDIWSTTIKPIPLPSIRYASGGPGCFFSRKAVEAVVKGIENEVYNKYLRNYNIENKPHMMLYFDDVAVGCCLQEEGINVVHDSRFIMDSPFTKKLALYFDRNPPYIKDASGDHLITQHYLAGKMDEIMKDLRT